MLNKFYFLLGRVCSAALNPTGRFSSMLFSRAVEAVTADVFHFTAVSAETVFHRNVSTKRAVSALSQWLRMGL